MSAFQYRIKQLVALSVSLACLLGHAVTASGQTAPTTAAPLNEADFNKSIVELYESEKLTSPDSYEPLLDLNARLFAHQHQKEIKAAFGDQASAINVWLAEHPEIKNELYTAIDPTCDDVTTALKIFGSLFELYPKKIASYSELAIATAVVWDSKRGVYDYARHQKRAKASMPSELANGVDGFKFLIDAEPFMEGRIEHVPWEFLTHVVNQKTPLRRAKLGCEKPSSKSSRFWQVLQRRALRLPDARNQKPNGETEQPRIHIGKPQTIRWRLCSSSRLRLASRKEHWCSCRVRARDGQLG